MTLVFYLSLFVGTICYMRPRCNNKHSPAAVDSTRPSSWVSCTAPAGWLRSAGASVSAVAELDVEAVALVVAAAAVVAPVAADPAG